MPIVRCTVRLDAMLDGATWTSLRSDLSAADPFTWRRGMKGGGPLDNVAAPGFCEFSLKNWADSGGSRLQGWYSPNHANVRTGFTFDIPVRVVATYSSTDYTLWRGRIQTIEPMPGQYGAQRVRCVARDTMADLAETEVNVAIQIDKTEVQCLQAIIAALPTDAAPAATAYGSALETFPYALDNLASGAQAMTGVIAVGDSCQGQIFVAKDGTFTYVNRHTWSTGVSDFTFTESMLDPEDGIEVPSDLRGVYDDVTAVAHPKSVSASIVLCGITSAVFVGAGQTVELWLDYRDPDNENRLIGGKNFTATVENTDYDARANADGTGDDLSGNLTVTVSTFAAKAKFSVTNNGATGAYLVNGSGTPLLQLRGDGLLDNQPDRRRSGTGKRQITIDLPYQADGDFAADVASFIRSRYESLADQVNAQKFNPQKSDALMLEALTCEIGDVKTVTETMTGLSALDLFVQGLEFECFPGDHLSVRYVTAPASPFRFWQWGITDSSEWGETAVYAF